MDDRIRCAGIIPDSIVDGPGLRFVLFVQGCPHRCPGCHNPSTWSTEAGCEIPVAHVVDRIRIDRDRLDGVTFSGGEPFLQAAPLARIAGACREFELPVLVYTGYTWEELAAPASSPPSARALIDVADILVDGRFEVARRSRALRFRGSANQRVIDVPASLSAGRAVVTEFPFVASPVAPRDPWSLREVRTSA